MFQQVYNGNSSTAPLLAEWCGYAKPQVVTSTSSKVLITMTADGEDPGTGLKGFIGYYFYHK